MGLSPSYNESTNEKYCKILQEPLTFPSSNRLAWDLLIHQLNLHHQRRLGANGAAGIKSHHFFANIDWHNCFRVSIETLTIKAARIKGNIATFLKANDRIIASNDANLAEREHDFIEATSEYVHKI